MKNSRAFLSLSASVLSLWFASCKVEFVPAEYKWTDTSDVSFYDSVYGEGFSKESGCTKITSDGTFNASSGKYRICNWMLSYDSKKDGKKRQISEVCGFEAKVKCSFAEGSTGAAGIQWMNDSSYDFYFFKVFGDGRFEIKISTDDINKILLSVSREESGIKAGEFCTIKAESQPDGDTKVFVNGSLVYTIRKDDLKIVPGRLAYAYYCRNAGNAWIQLLGYQQLEG